MEKRGTNHNGAGHGMGYAEAVWSFLLIGSRWTVNSELQVLFFISIILVKLQSFSRCSTTLTCDKNAFGAQCAFALKSDCQV